jgi:hypothetical protein
MKKIIILIMASSFILASAILYYSLVEFKTEKTYTKKYLNDLINANRKEKEIKKIELSEKYKEKKIEFKVKNEIINFNKNEVIKTSIIETKRKDGIKETFIVYVPIKIYHRIFENKIYFKTQFYYPKKLKPKKINLTSSDYSDYYINNRNSRSKKFANAIFSAALGVSMKEPTKSELEEKYIKEMNRHILNSASMYNIEIEEESLFIPFEIIENQFKSESKIEIISENELKVELTSKWNNKLSRIIAWFLTIVLYIIFFISIKKYIKLDKEL